MKKHLRKALSENFPPEALPHVYNSYDVVGDIAIIRSAKADMFCRDIAEIIMKTRKNVRTVLAQISPVSGDFRIRKLEYVAGEDKTNTIHKESCCIFLVDVAECYFSPRLSYERARIAKQVKDGEILVNMFAGVGCFSLLIAKHSGAQKIYSIDVNPMAVHLMQHNIRMNQAWGRIVPILGDAKEVIEKRLNHVADRILMPLPEKALAYLPCALLALKKTGGWIHYYDFEHAKKGENPIEKAKQKVAEKLLNLHTNFEFSLGRVVRSTGPNWSQIVLDIAVTR